MTELIMKAYDVLDEIKSDQAYQRFLELDKLIKKTLENEVFEFDQKKQIYQKVMALGGHYHPDFKEVSKMFLEVKQRLYEHAYVKEYLLLEKSIQKELNEITQEMKDIVSPHIKVPNQFGLMDKKKGHCK